MIDEQKKNEFFYNIFFNWRDPKARTEHNKEKKYYLLSCYENSGQY